MICYLTFSLATSAFMNWYNKTNQTYRAINHMSQAADALKPEEIKPPIINVGVIGWIRNNLFNGYLNSIITLLILFALWKIIPPFINWAFINSFWTTSGEVCQKAGQGACWSIVVTNFRFIIFGFYPPEEQWRPLVSMILLFILVFYSGNRKHWRKNLLYFWIVAVLIMAVLMRGGIFRSGIY